MLPRRSGPGVLRRIVIVAALGGVGFSMHPRAAQADTPGLDYVGLLRSRDLTPFGFLRLDMRPAHAVAAEPGDWGLEAELGYQNTWALSPEVEHYLSGQPRHVLGAADLAAIRALPGENYLVDLELAQLDVTLHYKIAKHWGAYLVTSGTTYQGGFLDSAIEGFHETFGFHTFGRRGASRDRVNILFDLKSAQEAYFIAPTRGGLLDPTLGVRYTLFDEPHGWNLVLEAATKIPLLGRRPFLSTGREDTGVQASIQRFWERRAVFASISTVYYRGGNDLIPTRAQWVPTVVVGIEQRLTAQTHAILQGYVSPSVYTRRETDLEDLRKEKYQLSLGFNHLAGRSVFTFAITENLQNINNTPDVGFQLGWAYSPAISRAGM